MRKILTEEILNNMVDDYHNGVGLKQLSLTYGFQEQTIQKNFCKLGLTITKSNARKFTKDEIDNIVFDYQQGLKPFELAEKYQRKSGTIIGKLKSIGVYENKNHRFTEKEIELLKQYYSIGDWESIYKLFPNVNKCSIYTKMSKLNVCMDDYFWSEDDVLKLKELYPNIGNNTKELVSLFNNKYTHSAILSKAHKLGLKTREFWTDEEISLLIENYHKKTLDELMRLLPNRKRDRIIAKANSLHLLNKCKYQSSEIEFIINNWKNMSDTEMSDFIGRPSHSIRDKRLSLGLLRLKEESSYNDLSEYIRRNNLEWKTQSMASCGYKCILTGDRFDDIHHIYGLNLILNETLVELGIEIKLSMDDYTEEELRDILDVFRIKQSKYPLGVCLSKNIHTLFHNKYGYGNNTQEQWNEFVVDFKDGKYNEFLNVA